MLYGRRLLQLKHVLLHMPAPAPGVDQGLPDTY